MNISYKDLKLLEIPFLVYEEQEKVTTEYERAYQNYIETISEAEKQWKDSLNRLQNERKMNNGSILRFSG